MCYSAQQHIEVILYLIPSALFTNWIAKKAGFFKAKQLPKLETTWYQALVAFGIYFSSACFIKKLFEHAEGIYPEIIAHWNNISNTTYAILNLTIFYCISAPLVIAYSYFKNEAESFWNCKGHPPSKLLKIFWIGAATWIISYPVVSLVSQTFELIVHSILKLPMRTQVAVKLMEKAFGESHPLSLTAIIIIVVILAPLIEEILFRGFLYNVVKKNYGIKAAYIVSASLFALVHYSPSQQWNNVPLLLGFLPMSFYLSYLFEKYGTIIAPYGLHFGVNLISSILIYSRGIK